MRKLYEVAVVRKELEKIKKSGKRRNEGKTMTCTCTYITIKFLIMQATPIKCSCV